MSVGYGVASESGRTGVEAVGTGPRAEEALGSGDSGGERSESDSGGGMLSPELGAGQGRCCQPANSPLFRAGIADIWQPCLVIGRKRSTKPYRTRPDRAVPGRAGPCRAEPDLPFRSSPFLAWPCRAEPAVPAVPFVA